MTMWALIKKNSVMFIFLVLILMTILSLYWFLIRRVLDTDMVIFQGQMMIYMLIASLINSEQREEKTRGYAFLQTLPITEKEIVTSKFVLVLMTIVLMTGYNLLMYEYMTGPPQLFKLGRISVTISATLALLVLGGLYVLVFRFGIHRMLKIGWALAIGMLVIPFLLIEFFFSKRKDLVKDIISAINSQGWLVWSSMVICGLVLYVFLLRTAVRAKEAAEGRS